MIANWRRKLPVTLQNESNECGLACLQMICFFHGKQQSLLQFRQHMPTAHMGMSLQQLMACANGLGVSSRALQLDIDELKHLKCPCILHWNLNHYVVLAKVTSRCIIVHDPAIGIRKLSFKETSKHFTGVALELQPSKNFSTQKPLPSIGITELWGTLTGLKRSLSVLVLLSILLQLCGILGPYYMQLVIDEVLVNYDLNLLKLLAIGFGLLTLFEIFCELNRQLVMLRFSSELNLQLTNNIFRHLTQLPLSFFNQRHVGDILSKVQSSGPIRDFISTGFISIFLDLSLLFFSAIMIVVLNGQIALLVAGFVTVFTFTQFVTFSPMRRLNAEVLVTKAEESNHLIESIKNIQTIKLNSLQALRQNQWKNKLTQTVNTELKLGLWTMNLSLVHTLLMGLEHVLVVYLCAISVSNNEMSIGILVAFMAYKNQFVGAAERLVSTYFSYKLLGVHLDRVSDVVSTQKEKSHAPLAVSQYGLVPVLQLKHISYRHHENLPLLIDDVSLKINVGECVAITGPSGSGKSTLLRLAMGLVSPSEGNLYYNGQVLQHYSQFGDDIASVMQNDTILEGSILDNVGNFSEIVRFDDVYRASKLACVHEEILALPMQYQTHVGGADCPLSGGQKQRLLLARALYKKPKILFLDEATSHLDTANETVINKYLSALKVTRFVVAHRANTLANADHILYLKNQKLYSIPSSHRLTQHKEKRYV